MAFKGCTLNLILKCELNFHYKEVKKLNKIAVIHRLMGTLIHFH